MSLQCYTGELFPRLEDYLIIQGDRPVFGSAIKGIGPSEVTCTIADFSNAKKITLHVRLPCSVGYSSFMSSLANLFQNAFSHR